VWVVKILEVTDEWRPLVKYVKGPLDGISTMMSQA
jgi:hypothetical protein